MTNQRIKIEDNFLAQVEFDKIHKVIMGSQFTWVFSNSIDFKGDLDKFQFTRNFYKNAAPTSDSNTMLESILEIIQPFAIVRIKANLLTRTPNIIENEFHVDLGDGSGKMLEKLKHLTTSIFYVNTNNGYTKFENGTKVESVANRMVTFPTNMKHKGTSCTDEQTRVVVNFNYFK